MSEQKRTDMTPVNVGAPVLIPQGNLNPEQSGSFAGILKAYNDANSKEKITTQSSMFPGFKPSFLNVGGDWQCMTNSTKP